MFVFGLFTTQLPWRQRLQTRAVCKRLYTCLFTRKEVGQTTSPAGEHRALWPFMVPFIHSKSCLAALAIGGRPGVCAWRRDEVDHVLVARALRGVAGRLEGPGCSFCARTASKRASMWACRHVCKRGAFTYRLFICLFACVGDSRPGYKHGLFANVCIPVCLPAAVVNSRRWQCV